MRRSLPATVVAAATLMAVAACGGGTPASAPVAAPASTATVSAPATSASPSTSVSPSADPSPSGSGIAALEGDEIADRAKEALDSAKSFRVKGQLTTGGEDLVIDMRLTGNGATGTVATGKSGVLKLIRVGKTAYLGGDKAFWTKAGGATAAEQLSGKFVKVPSSTAGFSQFIEFTELASWRKIVMPTGSVEKGDTTTIRGVPAVELTDGGGKDSLFIATEGKPYPLRLSGGQGAAGGTIEFSEYDKAVTLQAPAARNVITLP